MQMLEKLKQALDEYDPYGNYRVNAIQSVIVLSALLMLSAVINLPQFGSLLFFPVLGLFAILITNGYGLRLKAIILYSVVTILYAIALALVQNYRFLTVLMVGAAIIILFSFSKKRVPQLLFMIPFIHITAYTSLKMPVVGADEMIHYVLTYFMFAALLLGLLALFPRVYFFRIWLRVFYHTIKELEEKLTAYQHQHELFLAQPLMLHLSRLPNYTIMLSNKEHGFSARRISLKLMSINAGLMALIDGATQLSVSEFEEIRQTCQKLYQGLSANQPVQHAEMVNSDNWFFLKFQHDLNYITQRWNRLCYLM